MIITIYILSISSLILVITIIILINHYEKWINELIRKQLKLRTQVDEAKKDLTDYRKTHMELQETGYAVDTNIKSLIKEIDSFEKESSNKEDSIKYKLDFENRLTRIIEPQNTFKLINDTDIDLMVSVTKIVSNTIITDNKPYFIKLRKTNHIDIEHVSSMDTCF